ncbi:anti-sigma factor [Comamonas humi]
MSMSRPDETTLHAWVDGELAPESAAQVAQWLAEHPGEAARMAAFQAQRASLQALHSPMLDEPVPLQLRRALRRPPLQWRWPHALAAGVMLSLGLGLGYGAGYGLGGGGRGPLSPQAGAIAQLPAFVREAAAAHVVYVPEQRHPVEVAAQQQVHLVQWLSKRLGVQLKVPVLDAQGFQLVGGRLLPGEAGQSRAQFMYEDGAGERVTLYVSELPQDKAAAAAAPVAFQWAREGSTQGFYWIDGHQGYALSAALPRERLQVLADAVYRQLD